MDFFWEFVPHMIFESEKCWVHWLQFWTHFCQCMSDRLRLYGSTSSNQFPDAANGFQIPPDEHRDFDQVIFQYMKRAKLSKWCCHFNTMYGIVNGWLELQSVTAVITTNFTAVSMVYWLSRQVTWAIDHCYYGFRLQCNKLCCSILFVWDHI